MKCFMLVLKIQNRRWSILCCWSRGPAAPFKEKFTQSVLLLLTTLIIDNQYWGLHYIFFALFTGNFLESFIMGILGVL